MKDNHVASSSFVPCVCDLNCKICSQYTIMGVVLLYSVYMTIIIIFGEHNMNAVESHTHSSFIVRTS